MRARILCVLILLCVVSAVHCWVVPERNRFRPRFNEHGLSDAIGCSGRCLKKDMSGGCVKDYNCLFLGTKDVWPEISSVIRIGTISSLGCIKPCWKKNKSGVCEEDFICSLGRKMRGRPRLHFPYVDRL